MVATLDAIRTEASLSAKPGQTDCSTEVLRAFGLDVEMGPKRSGREIKAELERVGYRIETLRNGYRNAPTLAQVVRENPEGAFVLISAPKRGVAHSMALRSGWLTDTDLTGTGRRRVHVVYRVSS